MGELEPSDGVIMSGGGGEEEDSRAGKPEPREQDLNVADPHRM